MAKSGQGGELHPRNPHRGRYDLAALCRCCPELKSYLTVNPRGQQTIDFGDPRAVLCLNRALLAHHYGIQHWKIPEGYLCPPIPGRADYIHHAADLLAGQPQSCDPVRVLDIGTGANCIYPILGTQSYGWQCVASDIDPISIKNARAIVDANPALVGKIELRLQQHSGSIFKGIIKPGERYALTLCNPPFHASLAEAIAGNRRKWQNLSQDRAAKAKQKLNFGGQKAELWCPGGERAFLIKMAKESCDYASQVTWFTTLVSKSDNVRPLKRKLTQLGVKRLEVVKMSQGQKISRMLAWSFFSANSPD
ncbi:23S rRNA (adenine(1618)-N(6))-methyltransferase RlmF [Dongshaea marina]|uniref:23S rRNA (adenine(1618)-N(6))-methyltransferase RlmF n=1 Tax=Dongshaea marina TaxID=2047966 RepID=UPI000D3E828E|nr:23S rRNA (adenine(1618)-N(6))-methyltransferase RlmF [Dongshaea marina]